MKMMLAEDTLSSEGVGETDTRQPVQENAISVAMTVEVYTKLQSLSLY